MGISSLRTRLEQLEHKLSIKEMPTLNLYFNVVDLDELPKVIAVCQEHNAYRMPTVQRAVWVGAPSEEAQSMVCEYEPFKYQKGSHL